MAYTAAIRYLGENKMNRLPLREVISIYVFYLSCLKTELSSEADFRYSNMNHISRYTASSRFPDLQLRASFPFSRLRAMVIKRYSLITVTGSSGTLTRFPFIFQLYL